MLGYFALYSGPYSEKLRNGADDTADRRGWLFGRLPHQIAALNARGA